MEPCPIRVMASDGQFVPGGAWWWNVKYRAESERGLNDRGDLYAPGTFSTTLQPGACFALTLTTVPGEHRFEDSLYAAASERQKPCSAPLGSRTRILSCSN